MSFIASSMGRVIVAIISSAGITPLSTRITTRGKFVCGKTDDGTWNAAYDAGDTERPADKGNRQLVTNGKTADGISCRHEAPAGP